MRASLPACRRTNMLICSGFVGHWPRHSLWPALSTTQIAVIFCEMSNPAKQVIDDPPMVRIPGQRRPDRGTIGRSRATRDYGISTYDNALRTVLGSRSSRISTGTSPPHLGTYPPAAEDRSFQLSLPLVALMEHAEHRSPLSPDRNASWAAWS